MEFPAPGSHNAHGARRQFSRRNSIISPQGFGVLLTGAVFGGDLQHEVARGVALMYAQVIR